MAKRVKRQRSAPAPDEGRGGFIRVAGRIVLILVAIPLVLTPIYIFVPPVSTLMIYDRFVDGPIERQWVPFDAIAPSLIASAVMSEDQKFCSHWGVDWAELNKVLDDLDEAPRGASTITMQTVKNLFLWKSRSYVRKAIEIPLAFYANAVLGKRRQMEIYLNIVEFGPGIFGAEAAARHYFGRSAGQLSVTQSALLVAALPNPAARDPAHPGPRMRARAQRIASQARIAGAYIDCLSRRGPV
jgi:monofunctional biosynthetic peptidoglycan transglycosylase